MANTSEKRAALQQRLKQLDADEKRIADKRAQAEASLKALEGENAPKAERA